MEREVRLNKNWRIVVGAAKSMVEDTAAGDLQSFLKEKLNLEIEIVSEDKRRGVDEIIIGTPETCNSIKKMCDDRKLRITVDSPGPEAFQLKVADGCIFLCGFDPVGAMYGVFYLEDRMRDQKLTTELDVVRKPFFEERSCGAQWVQKKPTSYSEENLASWLAHHHFNLYGPIISPEKTNLSDGVAERYGIQSGQCVVLPRPTMEFINAHPECVHYDRKGAVEWGPSPTMCFRCEETQRIFSQWIQRIVEENPRLRQITIYFGDFASICSDTCERCGITPYPQRVIEVMNFLNKEARKVNPKVKIIGQTWLLHGEDEVKQIIENTPQGLGIMMNEPASAEKVDVLGFGSQEIWLGIYELDNTYGPLYLKAGKLRKRDFYPLMGIGDSCESVDPVVGMQLPWTAARKIRRAAENGMINICVWWGIHPWVYSSNHKVFKEMVFDPFQDIDTLIERIAKEDFGVAAYKEVLEAWRLIEAAFASWKPIVSWYERIEEYTGRCIRRAFSVPLTESLIEQDWSKHSTDWTLSMSKSNKIDWWAYRNLHTLVSNREKICEKLREALEHAQKAYELTTGESRVKARQQFNWLTLLYRLFLSQYHYFKTLQFEKERIENKEAQREWIKVVQAEIENCEEVYKLIDSLGQDISNISGISARDMISEDKLAITLKIKQMKDGIKPGNIEKTLRHKAQRKEDILSICRSADNT